MAITLDEGQANMVEARRKPVGERPTYYNATFKKRIEITEDFEAFLITAGNKINDATIKWLKEASDYSVQDSDRDALLASACRQELDDAEACETEISPIVDRFNRWKTKFKLTGFEEVPEIGLVLDDVQRPMAEIMNMASRFRHRKQCASFVNSEILTDAITPARQREIESWFTSFTAY